MATATTYGTSWWPWERFPSGRPAGEDHLLRSTSVVSEVAYAPGRVRYGTFDDAGEEVLRVTFVPRAVIAGDAPLRTKSHGPGFAYEAKTGVLRIRRVGARTVTIAR